MPYKVITIGLIECHTLSDQIRDEIMKDARVGEDIELGLNLLADFHSHFCVRWMAQKDPKEFENGYPIPQELLRQILDYVHIASDKNVNQALDMIGNLTCQQDS